MASDQPFRQARFGLSAPSIAHLPEDAGREVLMLGRSNVGKSSFINALCGHKSLAQTSKTPGRTRFLNVYHLYEGCRLIDAPGYGFARASKSDIAHWQKMLEQYIQERNSLGMVMVIMDIRHPLQAQDLLWLDFLHGSRVPLWIILNKKDTLGYGKQVEAQRKVVGYCSQLGIDAQVSLVSSQKKQGLEPMWQFLRSDF